MAFIKSVNTFFDGFGHLLKIFYKSYEQSLGMHKLKKINCGQINMIKYLYKQKKKSQRQNVEKAGSSLQVKGMDILSFTAIVGNVSGYAALF